jgi:hypothetical protein
MNSRMKRQSNPGRKRQSRSKETSPEMWKILRSSCKTRNRRRKRKRRRSSKERKRAVTQTDD